MKATVTKLVNSRREANTASPKFEPLKPSDTIDAINVEHGESINGNTLWLTGSNGHKYTADAFSLNAAENKLSAYIDFIKLWNFEVGKPPLKIGIYDGGVHKNFDLLGNRVTALNHNETDIVDAHGTYMATIIGGADYRNGYYGFLPNARFYSFQSYIDAQSGAIIEEQNFLNGLKAFLTAEVDMVNISMSTTDLYDFFTTSQELVRILNIYKERDITIVASVGNRGTKRDICVNFPAALSSISNSVICVGGCIFSATSVDFDIYNLCSGVNILGPSTEVYTNSYYSKFGIDDPVGTSVSTAVISGMLAAYKLKHANGGSGTFSEYIAAQIAAMPTINYTGGGGISKIKYSYSDFKQFNSTF